MLIGTEGGQIYSYQIEYDTKQDMIKEKLNFLIQLKPHAIFGIGVK
jgi:hypothetical protein